jgi:hypothetical protein
MKAVSVRAAERVEVNRLHMAQRVAQTSADREFWAAEDDGNVPVREEEIAEPLERSGSLVEAV